MSSAALGGVMIAAPTLTWTGDTADTTPDFDVVISSGLGAPRDAAAGDVLRIEYSANAGSSWNAYLTHAFIQAEIDGATITVSGASALGTGSYLFRARIERGTIISAWSASSAVTIVVTTTYYTTYLSIGQY